MLWLTYLTLGMKNQLAVSGLNSKVVPVEPAPPPHSDTPFFNKTHQFPQKIRRRPNPVPRPIQSTTKPSPVPYSDLSKGGQDKECRSSPHTGSDPPEPRKTNDHPWSLQGYDCDDPRGLQDVTYSRGEACIEKMKVRHIRNATLNVLQKLEYEKKTGVSCSVAMTRQVQYCGSSCLLYTSPSPRD